MADFKQNLRAYADLIVRVGVNLQPGQDLMITNIINRGVSLQTAPLVRAIAAAAYEAGSRKVDVIWSDPELRLLNFTKASPDAAVDYPDWMADALQRHVENGGALVTIHADDPGLLSQVDSDLVSAAQQSALKKTHHARQYTQSNKVNWLVIGASSPDWARRVFPDLPEEEAVDRLWETIFKVCRVDRQDPVAAWQNHIEDLKSRTDYLNHKHYTALKFSGPGTDLTVGLPDGHIWRSGRGQTQSGIPFIPNLPTEELFTAPHRAKVEGVVTATKPLSYGGSLIEDFTIRFEGGKVVSVSARKGENVLQKLVDTDEGSSRLGEVALVPYSSPISQTGIMFFNTLYDENAACHLALGSAYPFNLANGEAMSSEELLAAGCNRSVVHVDFMVGSNQIDVDGVCADGTHEAVMRLGEWAFDL
jgi:aminopeptidase